MTEDEKERFVAQLIQLGDIDMIGCGEACGIDFVSVVLPQIGKDDVFKAKIRMALERVKYKLLAKIYDVASRGKPKKGGCAELTYAKAIIAIIDDNILLGSKIKFAADSGVSATNELDSLEKAIGEQYGRGEGGVHKGESDV